MDQSKSLSRRSVAIDAHDRTSPRSQPLLMPFAATAAELTLFVLSGPSEKFGVRRASHADLSFLEARYSNIFWYRQKGDQIQRVFKLAAPINDGTCNDGSECRIEVSKKRGEADHGILLSLEGGYAWDPVVLVRIEESIVKIAGERSAQRRRSRTRSARD